MIFTEQKIKGVWIIKPKVFKDDRGYFMESFKQNEFEQYVGKINFIQDNESQSSRGVLRGLHYQSGKYSQAKLVRALRGAVIDVIVDLRKSSATFGQHLLVELNEENKEQLFVPRGFAHGFLVLEDKTIFMYKVDNIYSPSHEATLLWNDPVLNIDWKLNEDELILSPKDKAGKLLSEAIIFD